VWLPAAAEKGKEARTPRAAAGGLAAPCTPALSLAIPEHATAPFEKPVLVGVPELQNMPALLATRTRVAQAKGMRSRHACTSPSLYSRAQPCE